MAIKHAFSLGLLLPVIAIAIGRQATPTISYEPTYKSSYALMQDMSVVVGSVTDKRRMEPDVYHENSSTGDLGEFEKPITDIVYEAVAAELRRAGLTQYPPPPVRPRSPAVTCLPLLSNHLLK